MYNGLVTVYHKEATSVLGEAERMLEHLESSGLCARLASAYPDVRAVVAEAHRALSQAEQQLTCGAFDPAAVVKEVRRVEASLRQLWSRLRFSDEGASRPTIRAFRNVASS